MNNDPIQIEKYVDGLGSLVGSMYQKVVALFGSVDLRWEKLIPVPWPTPLVFIYRFIVNIEWPLTLFRRDILHERRIPEIESKYS